MSQRRLSSRYAAAVVALRVPIVLGWLGAAVAAWMLLPGLGGAGSATIGDVVPTRAKAFSAQQRAVELFGTTVNTDTIVVARNPRGLTAGEVATHVKAAAQLPDGKKLVAALPLVNQPLPGLRWGETRTTALSFLFTAGDTGLLARTELAERYARHLMPEPGTRVGVTGAAPARLAQFETISNRLTLVEAATVAVILSIVALYFRSFGAPLVTLGVAALAYVVAVRLLGWASEMFGFDVPGEIEPLLVVLLLGLVTDYTIFFLTEARRRLASGEDRLTAARGAASRTGPTVLAAGCIVAGCSAGLLAGQLEFFRVFGPGLAGCALIVTLVTVTLVPAVLALAGPWLFGRAVRAGRANERDHDRAPVMARLMAARPAALLIVAVSVAGLAWAGTHARNLDLGISYVMGLPAHAEPRIAGEDAARGFVAGILSPTDVVVEQRGIGDRPRELARLQNLVARERGVVAVLGPRQQRLAERLTASTPAVIVSRDGDAARLVVVLRGDPTEAPTIDAFERIRGRMPGLLKAAGLPATARLQYAGETPLAAETVAAVLEDLGRIAIAAGLITIVLLMLFLRAVLAPFLLLAAGALGYVASLGLTLLIGSELFGADQLTYYTPLVGLVLLLALGSDYNVFIAGRIRREAERRRLRDAVAVAAPAASRAITVAGLTLASTFALLALVPLRPFRELAVLLAVGVLVDALVVRPVLIPALVALAGERAWWPAGGRRVGRFSEYIARIGGRLGTTDDDRAYAAAYATLETLAERLGKREAAELARHLPEPLAIALRDAGPGQQFDYSEFLRRVAEREGTGVREAHADAVVVMGVVVESLPESELDYIRDRLSEDYRVLLGDLEERVALSA